jgi:hypothetical protein
MTKPHNYHFCHRCGPFEKGAHPNGCKNCISVHKYLNNPEETVQGARDGGVDFLIVIVFHWRTMRLLDMLKSKSKTLYTMVREAIPDDRNPEVTEKEISVWGVPLAVTRKKIMAEVHGWDQKMYTSMFLLRNYPITSEEFQESVGWEISYLRQKKMTLGKKVEKILILIDLPKNHQSLSEDQDFWVTVGGSLVRVMTDPSIDEKDSKLSAYTTLTPFLGEFLMINFSEVIRLVCELNCIGLDIQGLEKKKNRYLRFLG